MILAHSYTGQEVAPVSLAHFSRSFNSKVYYVLPGGHKINPQVRDRMHWNLCFQLLLSANKTEAQHHLLQTHTGTLSQATCQIHSVTHTTGILVRVGVLGWERIWQKHLTRMVSQNITVVFAHLSGLMGHMWSGLNKTQLRSLPINDRVQII